MGSARPPDNRNAVAFVDRKIGGGLEKVSPLRRSSATTRNAPAAKASSSPTVAPTLRLPFSAGDHLDLQPQTAQIPAEPVEIAGLNSRQKLGDVLVE